MHGQENIKISSGSHNQCLVKITSLVQLCVLGADTSVGAVYCDLLCVCVCVIHCARKYFFAQ